MLFLGANLIECLRTAAWISTPQPPGAHLSHKDNADSSAREPRESEDRHTTISKMRWAGDQASFQIATRLNNVRVGSSALRRNTVFAYGQLRTHDGASFSPSEGRSRICAYSDVSHPSLRNRLARCRYGQTFFGRLRAPSLRP